MVRKLQACSSRAGIWFGAASTRLASQIMPY